MDIVKLFEFGKKFPEEDEGLCNAMWKLSDLTFLEMELAL